MDRFPREDAEPESFSTVFEQPHAFSAQGLMRGSRPRLQRICVDVERAVRHPDIGYLKKLDEESLQRIFTMKIGELPMKSR